MTKTLKIVGGDAIISKATGHLATVADQPKAEQSVTRLLALDAPNGADLNAVTGSVPATTNALSARVQRNIRQAFDAFVRAQRGGQLADRTAEERLSSIQQMFVVAANFGGGNTQTGYVLSVTIATVAGELIQSGGQLVLP